MTEASHQMASNPLRGVRKPGSVGLAAGPEIAIMDEKGRLLGPRRDGRDRHSRRQCHRRAMRTIRRPMPRPSSTAGSAPATRASSTPTDTSADRPPQGDHQPRRRKNFAARGGRSTDGSPRGSAGCAPSPCPHDKLGEDVAAAVVLREGADRDRTGTPRHSSSERLAAFKTPRKILFLDGDPKGRDRKAATHWPGAETRARLNRKRNPLEARWRPSNPAPILTRRGLRPLRARRTREGCRRRRPRAPRRIRGSARSAPHANPRRGEPYRYGFRKHRHPRERTGRDRRAERHGEGRGDPGEEQPRARPNTSTRIAPEQGRAPAAITVPWAPRQENAPPSVEASGRTQQLSASPIAPGGAARNAAADRSCPARARRLRRKREPKRAPGRGRNAA